MSLHHLYIIFLMLGSVALFGQRKKEISTTKWQHIPRLIVPPGQTIQLKSNFLEIDTLIMHQSSGISLMSGDNVMIIGYARVSRGTRIIGRGKNGSNGQNGRNGEPAPRLPGVRDGGIGSNGNHGQAAPNLKLYLGTMAPGPPLNIVLSGGNGGNGGNGGDGGTQRVKCNMQGIKGTNGGDAGAGGNGGKAGNLILDLGDNISHKSISYNSKPGLSGSPGMGGQPGLVIINCGIIKKKYRPGNPGTFPNKIYTPNEPETNPDFLEFPSPIPTPSAIVEVPIVLPENPSFGTVEQKLASALKLCGYSNLNYRKYKDGFAIFTGIEHINSEGLPLASNDRFSPKKAIFFKDPSFFSFFKSLFTARIGYSRIIVFLVSDESISMDGVASRSEVINWMKSGHDELPVETGKRKFTDRHKLKALIYEFYLRENTQTPIFSEPTVIGIEKHLNGTNLWSILTTE